MTILCTARTISDYEAGIVQQRMHTHTANVQPDLGGSGCALALDKAEILGFNGEKQFGLQYLFPRIQGYVEPGDASIR